MTQKGFSNVTRTTFFKYLSLVDIVIRIILNTFKRLHQQLFFRWKFKALIYKYNFDFLRAISRETHFFLFMFPFPFLFWELGFFFDSPKPFLQENLIHEYKRNVKERNTKVFKPEINENTFLKLNESKLYSYVIFLS